MGKLKVDTEDADGDTISTKSSGTFSLQLPDDDFIPLPLWRKLCYSVGGIPMQLVQNVMAFFLSIYLLETAEIIPFYLSMIQLTARCADAVTDPIVGYLVLRTKRTKLGRKRPWILGAIPLMLVTAFFVFYTVDFDTMEKKFAYYIVLVILLQVAYTCYHVPYSSMTMVLSDHPPERDALTAYRMFSETLSILLGVAVFGSIIGTARETNTCLPPDGNITTTLAPIEGHTEAQLAEIRAYMIGAGVITAIVLVCALICFLGTKELNTIEEPISNFWHSVKLILTFKPYLLHMGAFLFMSLAIQFVQGNVSLYITHTLNMSSMTIPGLIAILATAIVLLPFAQFLIRKIGKKITMAIGMFIMFPVLIGVLFLPPNLPLGAFFPILMWAGITIALAMLTPWSMLPDVIDAFYLKYGMRQEAIFYSLIVFFNKFAVGISLAVSAGVLGLVGYDVEKCIQPPEVGQALRYLCGPTPLVLFLPGLVCLWFYPLTRKVLVQNREQLLIRATGSHITISSENGEKMTEDNESRKSPWAVTL